MKENDDLQSVNLLMLPDDHQLMDDDATIDPTAPAIVATTAETTIPTTFASSKTPVDEGKKCAAKPQSAKDDAYYYSPATQTLNALSESQQSADLHLSQLEYDAVEMLVQASKQRRGVPSSNENDEDATESSRSKHAHNTNRSDKNDRKTEKQQSQQRSDGGRGEAKVGKEGANVRQRNGIRDIQLIKVETGECVGTFPSYASAARAAGLGGDKRYIVRGILMGTCKTSTYNGYAFRYVDDPEEESDDDNDNFDETQPGCDRTARSIEQVAVATGWVIGTYSSVAKAAKYSGIDRSIVTAMLNGTHTGNDEKGFIFRYTDNDGDESKPAPRKNATTHNHPRKRNARAVLELDASSGKVLNTYPSLSQAARDAGFPRSSLGWTVQKKGATYKGKVWRYDDDEEDGDSSGKKVSSGSKRKNNEHERVEQEKSCQSISKRSNASAQCNDQTTKAIPIKKARKVGSNLGASTTQGTSAEECTSHPSGDQSSPPVSKVSGSEPRSDKKKREYEILRIPITQVGPLGLRIISDNPPDHLLALLRQQPGLQDFRSMPRVSSTKNPSIAKDAGVREQDWLMLEERIDSDSGENTILHAEYGVLLEVCQNGIRPITFVVAREKECVPISADSAHAEDLSQKLSNKRKAAVELTTEKTGSTAKGSLKAGDELKSSASSSENRQHVNEKGAKSARSENKDEVVPFCALCNGQRKSRSVHHAWCPKNRQFEVSGADKIFAKLQRGVLLGCRVCTEEYKTGRKITDAKHSNACRGNDKGKRELGKKDNLRRKKRKRDDTDVTGGNKECATVHSEVDDADSICLSHIGDDDNDSVYASPSTSRRPFQRLRVVANQDKVDANKPAAKKQKPKKRKKETVKNVPRTTKEKGTATQTIKSIIKSSKNSEPSTNPSIPKATSATGHGQDTALNTLDVEVDADPNEKITITWDDGENPWGPDGHKEGDVVIFSSFAGLNHHETILQSDRYELDPFATFDRYRMTHNAPEEGYQAIVLRRDPLATRPWGFSCQRHEFGGACLVNSVDPLSPAEAATFLGAGRGDASRAPLCVNDMLIAVNSKCVGGMTRTGVEIELEQSGPDLVLLVSRYKFADEVQESILEAEQSYLRAVDAAINDDRLLNWTDLGVAGCCATTPRGNCLTNGTTLSRKSVCSNAASTERDSLLLERNNRDPLNVTSTVKDYPHNSRNKDFLNEKSGNRVKSVVESDESDYNRSNALNATSATSTVNDAFSSDRNEGLLNQQREKTISISLNVESGERDVDNGNLMSGSSNKHGLATDAAKDSPCTSHNERKIGSIYPNSGMMSPAKASVQQRSSDPDFDARSDGNNSYAGDASVAQSRNFGSAHMFSKANHDISDDTGIDDSGTSVDNHPSDEDVESSSVISMTDGDDRCNVDSCAGDASLAKSRNNGPAQMNRKVNNHISEGTGFDDTGVSVDYSSDDKEESSVASMALSRVQLKSTRDNLEFDGSLHKESEVGLSRYTAQSGETERNEGTLNCSGDESQESLAISQARDASKEESDEEARMVGMEFEPNCQDESFHNEDNSQVAYGSELERDEVNDDGNAWYTCVCRKWHGDDVPVFWIQCDVCSTWYHASSRCLGFSEREAEYVVPWTCWGCPEPDDANGSNQQESQSQDRKTPFRDSNRAKAAREEAYARNSSQQSELSFQSQDRETQQTETVALENESNSKKQVFTKGDFVFVNEHAWPGVNNPEGIAKVEKAYLDDDDQVYDIKYVIGGRRKGVLSQFLQPHSF